MSTPEKHIVVTNKNTNFADWVELAKQQLIKREMDIDSIPPLKIKHGWENEHTPQSWADMMLLQAQRLERSVNLKKWADEAKIRNATGR